VSEWVDYVDSKKCIDSIATAPCTKKWIDRCFIWYLVAKRGAVESISYIWPTMTTADGDGAAAVDSRGA